MYRTGKAFNNPAYHDEYVRRLRLHQYRKEDLTVETTYDLGSEMMSMCCTVQYCTVAELTNQHLLYMIYLFIYPFICSRFISCITILLYRYCTVPWPVFYIFYCFINNNNFNRFIVYSNYRYFHLSARLQYSTVSDYINVLHSVQLSECCEARSAVRQH